MLVWYVLVIGAQVLVPTALLFWLAALGVFGSVLIVSFSWLLGISSYKSLLVTYVGNTYISDIIDGESKLIDTVGFLFLKNCNAKMEATVIMIIQI